MSWNEAFHACESRGWSLPQWKTRSDTTGIREHFPLDRGFTQFLFVGLLSEASGLRWTDDAPLVNFAFWRYPDIFNVLGKSDWYKFNDPRYMDVLNPPTARINKCTAAAHWQSMEYAWILIPCDLQFEMTLVCQKTRRKAVRHWVPYCLGQTAVVSDKCIVHVDIHNYDTPNDRCKPSAGKWSADTSAEEENYRTVLCSMFPETCNTTDMVISVQDVRNKTHTCVTDLPREDCPDKTFQCMDRSCISANKRCNNINDCLFGDDEKNCSEVGCEDRNINCLTECLWPYCRCRVQFFQCLSGGCIPAENICDFEENCADGSDELHCRGIVCSRDQRLCADGRMCIDQGKWFDGIEHCTDASDELIPQGHPCPGFQCRDRTCIPTIRVDDGVPDCPDAEDEQDFLFHRALGKANDEETVGKCKASNTVPCGGGVKKCYPRKWHCVYGADSGGNIYTCRNAGHLRECVSFDCPNMYKCPMSYCIPMGRVCNGIVDCQDGSDEHYCPMLSCSGMFRCQRDNICVHQQDVCDGKVDCKVSMDDEKYCVSKLVRIPSGRTVKSLSLTELIHHSHTYFVSLRHKDVLQIEQYAMELDSALVVLDLSHNLIKQIPPLALEGCPNLQFLFLRHNDISVISMLAFKRVGNLQILDLASNKLTNLLNQEFQGLEAMRYLDVSHNSLFTIEETFFIEYKVLGSVFHTDSAICCMIPADVSCEANMVGPASCGDLLLHPAFTFTAMAIGFVELLSSIAPVSLHFLEHKGILHLNLALADALFGCYLLILSFSDLHYRGRFSFYVNFWPASPPCYAAMLAFFLSFQQSLFSVLLISTHTCLLIGFPFKKQLHHRVMHFGGVMWFIAALQFIVFLLIVSFLGIRATAANQFCQSLFTSAAVSLPLLVTLQMFYGACLLLFCAVSCAIVVLIKRSLQMRSVVHTKSDVKRRVMIKSVEIAVINVISLGAVLITEGLIRTEFTMNHNALLGLTTSVMSISKLCNPWMNSLRFLVNFASDRNTKQSVKKVGVGKVSGTGTKEKGVSGTSSRGAPRTDAKGK